MAPGKTVEHKDYNLTYFGQPHRYKYQYIYFIWFLGYKDYLVYIYFETSLGQINISTNLILDINHKLLSLLIASTVKVTYDLCLK